MGKSDAIDLRVAGSNPAGQLLIYFHNVSPALTRILCQHSSLFPGPASKLSCANRGVAHPSLQPP